jgi:hypothetical protein
VASEVDIDPEFPDDDELNDRLDNLDNSDDNDTSDAPKPQVDDISNDVPAPANAMPFVPGAASKKNKKELDKALKEAERKLKKEQQEALKQAKEEYSKQLREDREAAKRLQQESRDAVQAIRAEAIGSRVNAYSLASALGFPGYTMASAADAAYIRPEEERKVAEQKDYQRELADYLAMLREHRERELAARQQEIKDIPVEAVVIDPTTGKPTDISQPTSTPVPNSKGWLPRVPSNQQAPQPVNPPGNQPSPPGTQPSPPGTQPPGNQPTPPGQQPPPPGNQPPPNVPPPPGTPPNVPPSPPTPVPSPLAGSPFQILQAVVQIAQTTNKAITDGFKTVSDITTAGIRGDSTGASKALAKATGSAADPLGVNIPITVAVQGFNALLDVNQSILESIKGTTAFAPLTLEATIEGDIKKLLLSIENAQRLDPVTAQLVEANNRLDMAWSEFRAKIILEYGPDIVNLLNVLSVAVKGLSILMTDGIAYTSPALAVIRHLLGLVADNTKPKDPAGNIDANILSQLEDFFKPSSMPADHKKAIDPLLRLPVP